MGIDELKCNLIEKKIFSKEKQMISNGLPNKSLQLTP